MNKHIAIASVLALAALSSCTERESPVAEQCPKSALETKAVNTSQDASPGSILLKFYSAPTEADFAAIKGVKSYERLFPSTPGKKELEDRFEMDKWYEVQLEDDADLQAVAESAAELQSVRSVEFNTIAIRPNSNIEGIDITSPAKSPSPTKGVYDIFNDPRFNEQWHYINTGNKSICNQSYAGGDINVKDVWTQLVTGAPDIIVAVVDEGVKYDHPDLAANMWVNEKELKGSSGADDDNNTYVDDIHGYNFVTNGPISWNVRVGDKGDTGHGTHTAGTIGAVNNNGLGVCGVAGGGTLGGGVKIMSCQIFSGTGGGSAAITAKAFKYAADMGASIISCSFGYKGGTFKTDGSYIANSGAEYTALLYFEATKNNDVVDGGIAIFASGNDALDYAGYPGALANVISVSAFGPDYLPAYYTNYGPGCKITAPGGDQLVVGTNREAAGVLSTIPRELYGEDYGFFQGTSMACPHVSGVAALGLAYARKLGKHYTLDEFKTMIVASAREFDSRLEGTKQLANNKELTLYNYRNKMGTGAIDAWSLMMKIEDIPSILVAIGSEQWIDLSTYFGTSSTSLTYTGVEISEEARAALGLTKDPEIRYGRLFLSPTKIGSAKIKVNAIGGGSVVGGSTTVGGMPISQEVSVISRAYKSNEGGWL